MRPWLSVIGIGEDGIAGLAPAARALIETAEVLVGGARHLGMVPDHGAERVRWERPLTATIDAIETRRGTRVAVLASGDPMWYGVGVTLSRRFPREEMTIVPQLERLHPRGRAAWVASCGLRDDHLARPAARHLAATSRAASPHFGPLGGRRHARKESLSC